MWLDVLYPFCNANRIVMSDLCNAGYTIICYVYILSAIARLVGNVIRLRVIYCIRDTQIVTVSHKLIIHRVDDVGVTLWQCSEVSSQKNVNCGSLKNKRTSPRRKHNVMWTPSVRPFHHTTHHVYYNLTLNVSHTQTTTSNHSCRKYTTLEHCKHVQLVQPQ